MAAEEGTPGGEYDPVQAARRLLRAARVGTLATNAAGHPFASLVTPACAPDLSVLMLLSRLSPHTRHLMADPRCSVLVTGTPESANPQTAPRVTMLGTAEPLQDAAAKARFLAVHPYASLYAGFGDFGIWRIRLAQGQMVGGFGRAHRLNQAELTPDPAAVAAIAEAEPGIITHCNQDHADALSAIAGGGDWRMTAVDVDGFDLADQDRSVRFPWRMPVRDAGAVRQALVRMARAARGG